MTTSLFDTLAGSLATLLGLAEELAADPDLFDDLLAVLGVPPATDKRALLDALGALIELRQRLAELAAQGSTSLAAVAGVLDALAAAFAALQQLEDTGGPLAALEGLGADVVTLLVVKYLESRAPALRHALALLTLLEPAEEQAGQPPVVRDGQLLRDTHRLERFRLDRLPQLLRDPVAALGEVYGSSLATTAAAHAMADKLFPRLLRLLRSLGINGRYGFDPDDAAFLGDAGPLVAHALTIYVEDPLHAGGDEAGLVLSLSSAEQGDLGLVVSPFGTLTVQRYAGPWEMTISLTAGVDVFAWGRHGLTLLADPSVTEVSGTFSAAPAQVEGEPAFVFGAADGTRLVVGGAQLTIAGRLAQEQLAFAIAGAISSSSFVIAPGEGDSFLRSILPADGLAADLDLDLAWSNTKGLTLGGSAELAAVFGVGLSLGGVTLSTVGFHLRARDADLVAEAAAAITATLGPVRAAVDGVGMEAIVSFPQRGANLGVVDLDPHFKPPSGVGLTVDAAVVTGGGFLRFDPQKQEYSGILELEIAEKIAVKGIGLLTTRLPDGGGFSLVVIIFTQGFTPIQLGLGFALTGIGGLLAINRTFDEEALRAGLKQRTLDSILFPPDPVRNAPQILGSLNRVFPAARGHHLFGPMLQIAWGTPPVITADLALVLEFGARRRLLILAQVESILPRRDHDLVRIKMDAVGVLDFDAGTAELDATLYDSRLAKKFVLTGDMAARLRWSGQPNFALAVGGLHPAFNPPPNFPKLQRIAVSLAAGDNPRLRCEAYFALTANTVQFGARAELYAAAAGFSIHGLTGFDVLIQLDPFQFLAEFYAQLQLKRGATNLFKVRVEGALAGPRPLHIKAKATFEILWWDYSIRVDKTLVAGEPPPAPEPIAVLPRLIAVLDAPGSWSSELPRGARPLVTLRTEPGAADGVRLHPLGVITVQQQVVPLDLEIDLFGQAPPADGRRFAITGAFIGGRQQAVQPTTSFFAPAQFFALGDGEKLARPSFEAMPAGIGIGADSSAFSFDLSFCIATSALEFETITMDKAQDTATRGDPQESYVLPLPQLLSQARFGAAGSAELRRSGAARYRTVTDKHQVVKEGWSIVATDDLAPQPAPGSQEEGRMSYSQAEEALRTLRRDNPEKAKNLAILRFQSEVLANA